VSSETSAEASAEASAGPPPPAPPLLRVALPLLFFISGAASLLLETVWTRQMVLVFGSTTFAVSTVLTAFMAGLAGGAWLAGRKLVGRLGARRAIALYALLELGIGLYALVLPALWSQLPAIHRALWGVETHSYHAFALLRFLLAFALLALPTVAMGATLPILARALDAFARPSASAGGGVGRLVGTLYAINTGGAVAGVFLAGFVLLPAVGMATTNLIACLADIALAGVAALLWWRAAGVGSHERPPRGSQAGAPSAPERPRLALRLALYSMLLSGGLSMAYEVAWSRALSLVIGSSTYAFSLILLCFLLGLAGGAALYARRQADKPDQLGNLATIHLMAAITALLGTAMIDRLPAVLLVVLKTFELSPTSAFALKFGLAAAVIVLPAFFMGMVFPAVVQLWSETQRGAGRTAGEVYAVNTAGSIIGSFAAGFVLVPWLGLQRTLTLLVLLGCALAAAFGATTGRRPLRVVRVGVAVLVAVAALFWVGRWDLQLLSSGVFRFSRYEEVVANLGAKAGRRLDEAVLARVEAARARIPLAAVVDTFVEPSVDFKLLHHVEGVTTTVGIGRTVDRSLSAKGCWLRHALLVNGKPDASLSVLYPRPQGGCAAYLSAKRLACCPPPAPGLRYSPSGDAETQLLSGLMPVLLGDGRARDGLIIGWGSGVTAGAARRGGLQRVVAVELEREVVRAARAFEPYNWLPQRDPGVKLITEDGRNYLARTTRRFDLIASEPSNPWMAGCGNLFTREFFAQVRAHLRPGGIFLQWLQAYEIAPANVWSILATMASEFPSVYVFSPVGAPTDLLLVARARPQRLSWPQIAARFAHAETRRAVAPLGIYGPADVLVRLRAGPEGVRQVSRGAPLNTDDNARIEFAAPRDLIEYRRHRPRTILEGLERTLRLSSVVDGMPPGADQALCMAELRAGRLKRAARRAARGSGAGATRCGQLAALMRRRPTRGVELSGWLREAGAPAEVRSRLVVTGTPQRAAATLAKRVGRDRDRWADAALAFLLTKSDHRFAALVLATAASAGAPVGMRAALLQLRARLLSRSRAHLAALSAAQKLAALKLSTGKTAIDRGSATRPSSRPASRATKRSAPDR
jgi:spermidine synthase